MCVVHQSIRVETQRAASERSGQERMHRTDATQVCGLRYYGVSVCARGTEGVCGSSTYDGADVWQ
jgi:hypothetical protein